MKKIQKLLHDYSHEVLLFLVLITIFKLPLLLIGGKALMRAPSILLLITSFYYIFASLKNAKEVLLREKFYAFLLLGTLISPLFVLFINTPENITGSLKTTFATAFTYGFTSLAFLVTLRKERFVEFIDTICITTIFIGGSLWLFESVAETLGYFNRLFFKNLIIGSQSNQLVARYGFQGDAVNSLATFITSGAWSYCRFFEEENKKLKSLFIITVIISALTIFLGESILSFLTFSFLIATITLFYKTKANVFELSTFIVFPLLALLTPNKHPHDIYYISVLYITTIMLYMKFKAGFSKNILIKIPLALGISFIGFKSNIMYRIQRYTNEDSALLRLFVPDISGCNLETFTKNTFAQECHFAEFHLFHIWNDSNFFILILTLGFISIAVFESANIRKYLAQKSLSLFFLSFSMILISVHYRPIATWGSNLFFSLGLAAILLWRVREPA